MSEIREATAEDYDAMRELHKRMELGYEFDPARTDFAARSILVEDSRICAAVLGRLTSEGYLLLDNTWRTPQDRWDAAQRLIQSAAGTLKLYGIEDTHVWLPPKTNCFVRRLRQLGFTEAPWRCLTARL
jgi:hypothetical protein